MATLVHLLKESAENFPASEAVVQGKHRVTYGELWIQICRIAGFLKSQRLERQARVAVLMENRPEYAAIYYGILAAGGVVVALNSSAKARTLVNTIHHSGATWLFAEGKNRELDKITEAVGNKLHIVTVPPAPEKPGAISYEDVLKNKAENVDLSQLDDPEQLASLIYTSGTTGDPKGVMLCHRNLLANTKSIIEYLKLDHRDIIVNVLPFYYSYGNSVLHTHLAVGGKLVLENSMVYLQKVLERMQEERATGFAGVPSTFALLLSRTTLANFDLSAVRYMTQAGGPMPPANVERFTGELPHVSFFVMYGQTEATARLSYLPPENLATKLGSCGIPIPNVEIDICDTDGTVLSPGATGEIRARGDNIMLGYWQNPEGTSEVLEQGWLKTGDLAHKDEDGYIYIDGRASDMIKSGAHRISPQEIEEVIAELDAVAEVAVTGIPDEVLGQVIKTVIVLKGNASLPAMDVQKYCAEHLAQYKIPKVVEFAEDLPRTASGKVRRHLI